MILQYLKEKQQPVCLYACIYTLTVYYDKTISVSVKEIAKNGGVISALLEKESV